MAEQTALRFGQKCGIGDEVRTRKNDRRKGMHNGQVWLVTEIKEDGSLSLESLGDQKRRVWVDADYAAEAVELAYAGTVDSAQGVTVDRAILDVDGMGRSLLYSGATRGRQAPVYVSAVEDGLAGALGRDDVAMTMLELLGLQQAPIRAAITDFQHAAPRDDGPKARDQEIEARARKAGLCKDDVGRWSTGHPDMDTCLAPVLAEWEQAVSAYAQASADAQAARQERARAIVVDRLQRAEKELHWRTPATSTLAGEIAADDLLFHLGFSKEDSVWQVPCDIDDRLREAWAQWKNTVAEWLKRCDQASIQRAKLEAVDRARWRQERPEKVAALQNALEEPYWESDPATFARLWDGFEIVLGRLTWHEETTPELRDLTERWQRYTHNVRTWPQRAQRIAELAERIEAADPKDSPDQFREELLALGFTTDQGLRWNDAQSFASPAPVRRVLEVWSAFERKHAVHRQREALCRVAEEVKQGGLAADALGCSRGGRDRLESRQHTNGAG